MTKTAASAPQAIEVRGLYKRYREQAVLEDVSLSVRPGEVYALTGPNGAGKTTLIRCMTGLAFPTKGRVSLLGRDVHTDGARARTHLGAVVEAPARFYPQLTGNENLNMHAQLSAMAPRGGHSFRVSRDRIREVLAQLELTRMADRKVAEFSLGQRQRLGVAAAILSEPKVLILDEPTSGLDPLGINLIHRIVTGLAANGCAVVLSTHHLREIATYAHTVGILTAARLVDTVDLQARQAAYRFRVDNPIAAAERLEAQSFVRRASSRPPYAVAHLTGESRVPDALDALAQHGFRVYEAGPDHFDLYEYYRERIVQG